ncbi:hypothetical protein PSA5_02450 [Pseudomonas syringae pv. actinidiae]|nr:hypothetical protein PSA5_02450 [Pseudomonas syringae pv. actinidiae]
MKSGAVVALGFARGHETMEAYRMALFCMAIGKEKFAELFGGTLKAGDWSSVGLSKAFVFDRGPAAAMNCEDAIDWLSRLELTPTHSGQSKASVESSHPREKQSGDQRLTFKVTSTSSWLPALKSIEQLRTTGSLTQAAG